jgi:anti-anti-sigma regulatory factor
VAVQDKSYRLSGTTLMLEGQFQDMVDMEFEVNISDLLEMDGELFTVDLTSVVGMGSYYIGVLVNAAATARSRNKQFRVVAVGKVGDVIQQVGLDQVG